MSGPGNAEIDTEIDFLADNVAGARYRAASSYDIAKACEAKWLAALRKSGDERLPAEWTADFPQSWRIGALP